MATDEDLEREGKNLLVAGIKALTAFLDGKAFFQIEASTGDRPPNSGHSMVSPPPGSVRRIRFMRDPA